MWDNLHEKAMLDIVNELLPFGTTNPFFFTSSSSAIISRLSNTIGIKAREMSLLTEDYLSPFGMAGLAAGVLKRNNKADLAGKPDDITVIVSVAVPLNRNKIHPRPQLQLQQEQQQQEEEEEEEDIVAAPMDWEIMVDSQQQVQLQVQQQQHVLEDHRPVDDHPSAIVSPTGEAVSKEGEQQQQQLREEKEREESTVSIITTGSLVEDDNIISPFPTGPLFVLHLQVRVYLYRYLYLYIHIS